MWSKPPWEKLPKQPNTRDTLVRWRRFAREAAVAKGARRACGICKRATMGCASVDLSPPWGTTRTKLRSLCSVCWRELVEWIDEQEYNRNNYAMGIDWVAGRGTLTHASKTVE